MLVSNAKQLARGLAWQNVMAQSYRKVKQNHALRPSYVCPLVRQLLFMARISDYSGRGSTESKGSLQLPSNSTSVKSPSSDVVHAQCLEDNTGNLKWFSGEPFLRRQKRISDKVNAETVPTTVRKKWKEMSKSICSVRDYSFGGGMTNVSWVSRVCVSPNHPWPQTRTPSLWWGFVCHQSIHGWWVSKMSISWCSEEFGYPRCTAEGLLLPLMLNGKLRENFKPIRTTFLKSLCLRTLLLMKTERCGRLQRKCFTFQGKILVGQEKIKLRCLLAFTSDIKTFSGGLCMKESCLWTCIVVWADNWTH